MTWAYIGAAAVTAVGGYAASKNAKVDANIQSPGAVSGGGQTPGTGPFNQDMVPPEQATTALAGLPTIGMMLASLPNSELGSNVQPTALPAAPAANATPGSAPAPAPAPPPEAPKTEPPNDQPAAAPATPAAPTGWGEVLSTAAKVMGNPVIQQLLMGGPPQTRQQVAAPVAGGGVNPQVMGSFALNRGGVGSLLASLPRIGGR